MDIEKVVEPRKILYGDWAHTMLNVSEVCTYLILQHSLIKTTVNALTYRL